MAEDTNRHRVDRFIAAYLLGNLEEQRQLVHPEVVFHSPESLPYGGKWHGHDGWQSMKKAIAEVWTDLDLQIDQIIGADDGDCFVIIATLKAGSRKTGRLYQSEIIEQWHWRDGLLALVRPYYWDTAQVAEVIGKTRAP